MENLEVFGKYKDKITSFISGMNLSHMRLLKIILIRKLFNNDFFLNHELNLYLFSGSADMCLVVRIYNPVLCRSDQIDKN